MIQRIQTIFMFLAVLCLIAFFYFEIIVFTNGTEQIEFDLCFLRSSDTSRILPDTSFVMVAPYLVVAVIAMILVNIFLFRNRKMQIRLGNFIILSLLGILTWMLITPDKINTAVGEDFVQSVRTGYFLPIAAIAFMILAVRSVKSDEALVKSTDRLR